MGVAIAKKLSTYLVQIPRLSTLPNAQVLEEVFAQRSGSPAFLFEEVFNHLHETLRGDQVSFEIVASVQNVAFSFTAEPAVCEIVAGQIYAIAPDAQIVLSKGFTEDISRDAHGVAVELYPSRTFLLPLKDYREFEGDSVAGVLSVLSECLPGEKVLVQLVIKPRRDTGAFQFMLSMHRKLHAIHHFFRIKYWFKQDLAKSFAQAIKEKTSSRLFYTNLRVCVISDNPDVDPKIKLKAVSGALANFNTVDFNELVVKPPRSQDQVLAFCHQRSLRLPFLLSVQELATFYHLPTDKAVRNLVHVLSRKGAPPTDLPTDRSDPEISFFGRTNFRKQRVPFGIRREDRRRHLYLLGKSGSGKSKLLELLVLNDINAGHGVGVLDPHGDLVENILRLIPEDRVKDVVLFDPADLDYPPSFNPLEKVPEELKMRVVVGFIEIFKKLFGSSWSPRTEHVLRYTTLALLDTPGTTVLSILKMLSDKNYRQMVVRNIKDNVVKNFWVNEFAAWSEKFDNEAITPLLNKVGQFVSTNMIRNIVGQPENRINFREIMDQRKILLMKVSKGMLGEENAALLGSMAITKIYQSAMARADTVEKKRVDFYFYVDEFHNFATDTFDEILSEARKYRLNLTLANQFLGQLPEQIRKTVFGNVGSMVSFRVGGEDAPILATEFSPRFYEADIINLGVRDFYVKMSINGEVSDAFSGRTLDIHTPDENCADECREYSRRHYAAPIGEVQKILAQWEDGTQAGDSGNSPALGTSMEQTPSVISSLSMSNEPVFEPPII